MCVVGQGFDVTLLLGSPLETVLVFCLGDEFSSNTYRKCSIRTTTGSRPRFSLTLVNPSPWIIWVVLHSGGRSGSMGTGGSLIV